MWRLLTSDADLATDAAREISRQNATTSQDDPTVQDPRELRQR
jgi:hypothetical protein